MCGPDANSTGFTDPGYMYDVLLRDLEPVTRYYYSYGFDGVSCIEQLLFFNLLFFMILLIVMTMMLLVKFIGQIT